MQPTSPDPKRSLAAIFGASRFTGSPNLTGGRSFYNSANGVFNYLTSNNGLGLDETNVLWLFDDSRPPSAQLDDLANFLVRKQGSALPSDLPENLFIFYVGHGMFTSPPERKYCLAVRCTKYDGLGRSTIRGSDLADVISENAINLRRFLILDCCHAAAMYKEFMSAPGDAGMQLLDELPLRGTTLLCASSSKDVALAKPDLEYTMFSDALLKALSRGSPALGPRMSVAELGKVIKHILRTEYPSEWVRPEIHSPDVREGDISALPLFPNPARCNSDTEADQAEVPRKVGKKVANCREELQTATRTDEVRSARCEVREAVDSVSESHDVEKAEIKSIAGRKWPLWLARTSVGLAGLLIVVLLWLRLTPKGVHPPNVDWGTKTSITKTAAGESEITKSEGESTALSSVKTAPGASSERGPASTGPVHVGVSDPSSTPNTELASHNVFLRDDFASDHSLNSSLWTTSSDVLSARLLKADTRFVPVKLAFTSRGLTLGGVNARYQSTGIQSKQTFSPPLTLEAKVMGTVSNGNAFALYLVSGDGSQYLAVNANLDRQGGGVDFGHTGSDNNSGNEKSAPLMRGASVNTWYVIRFAVDSLGMGVVSIEDLGEGVLDKVRKQYVGTGPFYVVLGQWAGWPRTTGTNEAIWASITVSAANRDGT